MIQRKWLSRFGGQVDKGRPFPFWEDLDRTWALWTLRSPEYSRFDLLRFPRANSRARWALFAEFKQLDFMETARRIEVPVYFLMGRHDYDMQPALLEEPARFGEVMVTRVLAETLAAQQRVRDGVR